MNLKNKHHARACITGSVIATIILVVLILPPNSRLHAHGPMNTGHADVKCEYCHQNSDGSLRQQLQANVQYLLGNRPALAETGLSSVGNKACISCHDRPRDNHPVYRFNEPKFSKARKAIQPHLCISCHREHTGKRVTRESGFCKNCHKKLNIKRDKISTSHQLLVKQKKWSTCLGCHDFHGNHKMTIRKDVAKVLTEKDVTLYFEGGQSPYSRNKSYKARKTPWPSM